jgi:biopolymer transport protein ExbD
MSRRSRHAHEPAELDITGLLNVMIVLVPVLLMTIVFSQITVLNLKLPEGGAGGPSDLANEEVELVIRADHMEVNFPRGTLLKTIPNKTIVNTTVANTAVPNTEQQVPDFDLLNLTMQDLKKLLTEKNIEKKAITILSEAETPYQTLIAAVDASRSYKTVVAAAAVDAELFPEVTFGDAPVLDEAPVSANNSAVPAKAGARP